MSDSNPPPPDSPYGNQPPNQPYGNQPYGNQPTNQPYGNQPPNQPYGNQPYGSQPYGGAPANQPKGLAIASLVLGIIALLSSLFIVGIVFGIVGLVLGFIATSKAKKGTGGGRGMAIAGIVLSIIAILISVAVIVAAVFFANSDSVQNLSECLDQAGNDTAAQQQCQDDFADNFGN